MVSSGAVKAHDTLPLVLVNKRFRPWSILANNDLTSMSGSIPQALNPFDTGDVALNDNLCHLARETLHRL